MIRLISLCLTSLVVLAGCSDKKPGPVQQTVVGHQPLQVAERVSEPANQSISPAGSADRLPPPVVPSVERDGVRYAQAEDGRVVGRSQVGGVLVASAADSGKRLWTLVVYGNSVNPEQEADAQWVFFKSMSFDPDGRLRIVNEADQTYFVDVHNQTVSPAR